MERIRVARDADLACRVDDYVWPWEQGTPVLLQHGFARNGAFWNAWVPQLAGARRVYRPDLRGCGDSAWSSPPPSIEPARLVADLVAVLDHFGLERVHFVGESLGGVLGIQLALAVPDRVLSLTLVNTPFAIDPEVKRFYSLD